MKPRKTSWLAALATCGTVGLALASSLGTTLQNRGCPADLALPWGRPHSGDYDLDQLFGWVARVRK